MFRVIKHRDAGICYFVHDSRHDFCLVFQNVSLSVLSVSQCSNISEEGVLYSLFFLCFRKNLLREVALLLEYFLSPIARRLAGVREGVHPMVER